MPTLVRALIVEPDGSVDVRDVQPTLSALQSLVGGYLEAIELRHDAHLYCDEDGNSKELPLNLAASLLVQRARPGFGQGVRGRVVVLGHTPDGQEADVPLDLITAA